MPITPDPPYPKSPGDPILSQDWNQAVDEVIRLDTAKVDRAGDTLAGNLTVGGDLHTDQNLSIDDELTVGSSATVGGNLSVSSFATVGGTSHQEGRIRLFREADEADAFVSHAIGTEAFYNRYGGGSSYPDSIGHRFYRGGGELIAQIGVGGNGQHATRLNSEFNGSVTIQGDLNVPKTGGTTARLTSATFSNEASLPGNNLKLVMASGGIVAPEFEFTIGHTFFILNPPVFATNYVRNFAVNHLGNVFVRGNLTVGGSKGGYVVDHFINRAGDALELGDVVVISTSQRLDRFTGLGDNIPVPEVDLTTEAYDTRVCGVVAQLVTEDALPPGDEEEVELDDETRAKIQKLLDSGELTREDLAAGKGLEGILEMPEPKKAREHPLKRFAAEANAGLDPTQVQDEQLGHMVTLGCFAHCKVDADIASIKIGDLLTTSPTKGHAQKVEDPAKAVGAIIGKALRSMKEGKGKIPVLVMLQ